LAALLGVFEDELLWRDEMSPWTDRPGVRFDRQARIKFPFRQPIGRATQLLARGDLT